MAGLFRAAAIADLSGILGGAGGEGVSRLCTSQQTAHLPRVALQSYRRSGAPSSTSTCRSARCTPVTHAALVQNWFPSLQNYRRNGDPFINYLSLNPVHDATGRLTHYVGVQVRAGGRV